MSDKFKDKDRDRSDLSGPPKSHIDRIRQSEGMDRALLARPRLSLRVQVLLAFLVVFLFAVGIATFIIVSIYRVEEKVRFLEIVNDYVLEVDQARRYEKNFFLYGSNLNDALDAAFRAKAILEGSKEKLSKVVGPRQWRRMYKNVDDYEKVAEQLLSLSSGAKKSELQGKKRELEVTVRKTGQRMVLLAKSLMKKERHALETAIAGSRKIQIYSLVFLLLFMITAAYMISGHILRSIVRFETYTERIAVGDFTPITPTRRYRDEFTDLALGINHMMRELQKHEAMLVQAHKMRAIGTLTAGVAHELNNPLNNITITAHMLLEEFEELTEGECKEMVEDIVSEGDRVKKIVSNLLDFTRESETRLEPLDLVQLVKDTIDLARNQVKFAGIRIELSSIDDPPRILGDSQQLTQVFLNLILNAIAASEKGGKLQLLVQPSDEPGNLSVKVIDYGTGIPDHILARIFDPFFTTKEKGKGTGLGLSVSQGIVAKHGGRMLVDSQEGRGTTFTVILPVR
ncbi:MAG: HAMP domain-containing sensor histidine kinase [bacterium]